MFYSQMVEHYSWHLKTMYVEDLPLDKVITVKYLNRSVTFKVILFHNKKMLQVLKSVNSSLAKDDVLAVDSLRVGNVLEAKTVYRGEIRGNYRTNGELKEVIVNEV